MVLLVVVAKFLLWGSNIYIYFLFFAEMGFFFFGFIFGCNIIITKIAACPFSIYHQVVY